MPTITALNCLAAFIFPTLAACGWALGSWAMGKFLK